MIKTVRLAAFFLTSTMVVSLVFAPCVRGQQTLGGITGTVTDSSGAVVPNETVTLVGDET